MTIVPDLIDAYLDDIYQSVLEKQDYCNQQECMIEASISEIFESAAARSEASAR